jgi:YidC/Oxa1 family membrane protein insertase
MFVTLFYQPILNLVVFIYNNVPGHDFGITIIILTIIIKLLLYPLTNQSIKSQKALQDIQPQIDEIKNKYKDQKDKLGKEILEVYKKNKVNPLSSCLPLLIQLPFLIAVFRVIRNGFNDTSANLIYSFISKPQAINYVSIIGLDLAKRSILLAVLSGVAQFWQSKMLLAKRPEIKANQSKDEDMAAIMNKQMTYFMPIFTVFIGLSFPGGLTLYWFFTTLLSGLQQLYIFKKAKKQ